MLFACASFFFSLPLPSPILEYCTLALHLTMQFRVTPLVSLNLTTRRRNHSEPFLFPNPLLLLHAFLFLSSRLPPFVVTGTLSVYNTSSSSSIFWAEIKDKHCNAAFMSSSHDQRHFTISLPRFFFLQGDTSGW